ncbi:hypothetical protein DYBT9275_00829 [Dyadobacter sp. CECT 9275]|uniref:Peptidase S8/S53 domain-containing protein n=1 Tax=Dyadobacter helix TaxID=2822344 RepID=A0A916J870_9BACT|nr:S8 family peptidase [Dyadobacter sp. CECT 9275]CAG4991778.1 hypothetical protein DYBT9275_00829 [Dyadobacter sp. CECT 9275]
MKKYVLLFSISIFILKSPGIYAQAHPRYFVLFKDKANTPFSVSKPLEFLSERAVLRRTKQNISVTVNDLPVNPSYIAAVNQTGGKVIYSSRWFNGVVVEASDTQLESIKKLSFYKSTELNNPVSSANALGVGRIKASANKFGTTEDLDYGAMRNQLVMLGADVLHKKGFHGEGMLIGVFDAGFNRSNELGYLKHLYDEKRVIETYDFIARNNDVYDDHWHGNAVLSTMAAYQPGSLVGVSYKAAYVLYRTENNATETPYEEVTWLIAAERADSLGVDVINTSLGYFEFENEFNTPAYNHTYQDMDGKTTIISRAAKFACRAGILVVNAAGNEGNNQWRYITAPADVDSVLTVGACNYDKSYAPLSSIGPNAVGLIKPDVAAVGAGTVVGNNLGTGSASTASGTSFASPQIAGLAAILWQAHPSLNAGQIIDVLKKSGNQAPKPDFFLGYGVPGIVAAEEVIQKDYTLLGTEPDLLGSMIIAPNPVSGNIILKVPVTLTGRRATFRVRDQAGTMVSVSEGILTEETTISTPATGSGLYLLEVGIGKAIRVVRFVKK